MKNNIIKCQKLATNVSGRKNDPTNEHRCRNITATYKTKCNGKIFIYAVIFRHLLIYFRPTKVVLRFFDPKQLLRVSCILRCYFTKLYWITIVKRLTQICNYYYTSYKYRIKCIMKFFFWQNCQISDYHAKHEMHSNSILVYMPLWWLFFSFQHAFLFLWLVCSFTKHAHYKLNFAWREY